MVCMVSVVVWSLFVETKYGNVEDAGSIRDVVYKNYAKDLIYGTCHK